MLATLCVILSNKRWSDDQQVDIDNAQRALVENYEGVCVCVSCVGMHVCMHVCVCVRICTYSGPFLSGLHL